MPATAIAPLRRADVLRTPWTTRLCLQQLMTHERARSRNTLLSQGCRHHSSSVAAASARPGSSVSASEVSHFSRLASSWWDPHGPSRLLHLMNPLRHDFIRSCVQPSSSERNIENEKRYSYLDVGCGGGIFASSAARLTTTLRVTAIDPTEDVIQVAKEHQRGDPALAAPGKLEYINCAIEDLPVPVTNDAKYDVLTVFEVLEHIDSPASFLDLAIPHLKPGGWLIGSTIARSPVAYLTTKLIAEAPLIGVVPRGTHDWDKYINPSELRGYFESGKAPGRWAEFITQGVVYLPALGWQVIQGSEEFGNYFFGVQKLEST
ncbi:3-demethylubiquinone-9 3-O-methyltransferase [Fonsecaea erecta]|uniref:Ubiquinone biosynthesis O-methyltransferase, mitochondrial n=1 Tax=Fonsecaea erecta TaxID=1367422 RepID=A0A178ZVP1_9EURO|nr:3-demethylubiquinone-9 3-O-methyltransferase [Fonsecaea erecta]OAP63777.1 3-demethylubiquinone-9 3-O-methyltransferase [Fonsecaea erecta]